MKKIFLLLVSIFLFVNVFADKNTKKEKVTFTVHMRNGDVISGTTSIRTLIVSTSYGPLAFPITAINNIKVGIYNPELDKEGITKLLDQLYNMKPEVQKSAFESLMQQEPSAIAVIKDYMNSENYTPTSCAEYSVEAALQQLVSFYNVDEKSPMDDVVKFDDNYLVEGVCNFSGNIQLETAYGNIELQRKSIISIDVTSEMPDEGNTKTFILNANKNISGNADGGFFSTGINVKEGKIVIITANGKVVLASLSNNSYTPDGGVNGAPAPSDGGTNAPSYGHVVFKIGENGQITKAGASYRGKANSSGILYLAIYETVFNAANSGTYKVKVRVMD